MSTPENTIAGLASSIPARAQAMDADLVASFAREFWKECTAFDQFDHFAPRTVPDPSAAVADRLSAQKVPFDAGYPGTPVPDLPSFGFPNQGTSIADAPYYLAWSRHHDAPKPELTVPPSVAPELARGLAPPSTPGTIASARRDFPILSEVVDGKRLVWLDNAATTQKPQAVIDRVKYFYEHENSNIHRAAHTLAARSTDAYESARGTVARFINAGSPENIVFVRGATEGINLVAQAWGRKHIQRGDEIVITWLEHHSNIVPWQQLIAETGATLRVVPVDSRGQVLLNEYERLLGPRTKLVSVTHVSNALGTVVPVEEMIAAAHRHGAKVLVDGAQSISHMPVDVRRIDADFFVLSGHKVFAPTGIGALYGKPDVLESMPPWQGGGNMISDVTFERTVYTPPPARFEAGTGNISDAIGLGAALEYLERLGMVNVAAHEHDLIEYATRELQRIPGLRIIGTATEKAGVISFVMANHSVPEIGVALAAAGIAVRAGHHCAQPALRRFGLEATVRPSFALYNNYDDIDALVAVVNRLGSGTSR